MEIKIMEDTEIMLKEISEATGSNNYENIIYTAVKNFHKSLGVIKVEKTLKEMFS